MLLEVFALHLGINALVKITGAEHGDLRSVLLVVGGIEDQEPFVSARALFDS